MALQAFIYPAAISASDAAPTTGLRMLASAWIDVFKNFCCYNNSFVSFRALSRKWKPPTLLLDFDADQCEASEITHSYT